MVDNNDQKKKIMDLISNELYKPMKKKELAVLMQVPREEKENFESFIQELIVEGKITITRLGKLIKPEKLGLLAGTFIGNANGFGFVMTDGEDKEDIFIAPSNINGALHKDRVFCAILTDGNGRMRREGQITAIIKRGFKEVIGTYEKYKGFAYVIPDERKIRDRIIIRHGSSKGAVDGHKVVVKLDAPSEIDEPASGVITEILGHKNDPGIDVYSIIRQLGIRSEFGKKIRTELEYIPDEVLPEDCIGRTDLRNENIITIDGEDTKDIDDAISLTRLANGGYRLGVHIADVSHYVRENTELDNEAYKRGTSIYLADRVIPMLPHKLSNGICSLNPHVDRLALSCIMEINQKGVVENSEILNSIINVRRQTTYTAVNAQLSGGDRDEYYPMLKNMKELADILKEKRIRRGAIEFDFPESKITVDDNGWPTDIAQYARNSATEIIEEFMIACNETIAETFFWLELPFVYRTHEKPDEDKLQKLTDFLKSYGYSLRKSAMRPSSIQGLLTQVTDTPEESVINRVVLRSLKQASYTAKNIGHFGLASKYYCHFTSPIRRYPDLQIHRIIKEHIAGGVITERVELYNCIIPEVCRLCSVNERLAESAEQEVDKLKKAQYMSNKIGMKFEGLVSGFSNYGVFVMLPNTVEGMITRDSLRASTGERYYFNQDLMHYEAQETGRTIALGERLRVELADVNILDKNIDFILAK